jgi:hypothetical protein
MGRWIYAAKIAAKSVPLQLEVSAAAFGVNERNNVHFSRSKLVPPAATRIRSHFPRNVIPGDRSITFSTFLFDALTHWFKIGSID